MAYLMFVDESGQDGKDSPYEVLAGVAVKDSELWNLVQRIHSLERDTFGMRISEGPLELKAKKILKRKTFRLAGQGSATEKGRMRSSRIIPEPFFVHSELTTAVQLADLVAYITCWGVQVGSMPDPERPELKSFASQVCQLRYRTVRQINGQEDFVIWSFAIIDDLRSRWET